MKIAIVNWLINDCGGIISYGENLIDGLRMNGHEVEFFYATQQARLNCNPKLKIRRGVRYDLLPSFHLSYQDKFLNDTIKTLNLFDLIIFLHPSPHPTKANFESLYCHNWKKLYTDTTPKNIVIFHDRKWQVNNYWFSKVSDHVDFIIAAQKHFMPSVLKYPAKCKKIWEYFPLCLDTEFPNKENFGIVCTQWIPGKNHKKTIPLLKKVIMPMKLFGNGIEYCKLRANGILYAQIKFDYTENIKCNENSLHEFFGFIEYSELMLQMKKAICSIDWSYAGMTNMTHWEPLCSKTINVVESRTYHDSNNTIPKNCMIEYNSETYYETLNEIYKNGFSYYEKIISEGWKFVQIASKEKVAKRILEKFNEAV